MPSPLLERSVSIIRRQDANLPMQPETLVLDHDKIQKTLGWIGDANEASPANAIHVLHGPGVTLTLEGNIATVITSSQDRNNSLPLYGITSYNVDKPTRSVKFENDDGGSLTLSRNGDVKAFLGGLLVFESTRKHFPARRLAVVTSQA